MAEPCKEDRRNSEVICCIKSLSGFSFNFAESYSNIESNIYILIENTCVFVVKGLQWIKAELIIIGSRSGTNCHAHDREGSQGWHMGGATELSSGHIMDAYT